MSGTLLATASVHTTAAACDYLDPILPRGERVVVLTVTDGGVAERDAGDAANVARTRLPGAAVEARTEPGAVAPTIRRIAREMDADRVVVGATHGAPDAGGAPPGSTVLTLIQSLDRPLVVVPVLALE